MARGTEGVFQSLVQSSELGTWKGTWILEGSNLLVLGQTQLSIPKEEVKPQASSPFQTLTAGCLQSWDRRVRPRLV